METELVEFIDYVRGELGLMRDAVGHLGQVAAPSPSGSIFAMSSGGEAACFSYVLKRERLING